MKNLFLIWGLIFLFISCDNRETDVGPSGKSIDFYGLSHFDKQENSFKIMDSTAIISDYKIIAYKDIISYSPSTHTFMVSDSISDRLNDIENQSVHGMPFAITVDKEIIYTGYFWAGFSSLSCDWVVIDPLNYARKNKLKVKLGYAASIIGDNFRDKRNDTILINILKLDKKLID